MKVIGNPIKYMYELYIDSYLTILNYSNMIENQESSFDERAIRLTCGIEIFVTYDSASADDEGDVWFYPDRYVVSLPISTGESIIREKIKEMS